MSEILQTQTSKSLNHLTPQSSIAIVGAGPAGLTLARLLQLKGLNVKVYERDLNRDARVQGATLDLHQDAGLKALRAAGLLEEFKRRYRPYADIARFVDEKAVIHLDGHDDPNYQAEAFENEHFRPEIDRGPLRTMLLDSLQPETVVWNSHILALEPVGNAWKLEFENRSTASADLVIAADGAGSKVRPFVTPIKPFYTGVTAVEGAVYDSAKNAPRVHGLLKGGKIFALGNSQTLIISSKGDGSLAFYLSFNASENWVRDCGLDFTSNAQMLAWFKQQYPNWDSIWFELFENADSHYVARQINSLPVDQTWEPRENITLIGDAAHLMTPFAGEGVNVAMLDALELAIRLTDPTFPTLRDAIAAFESEMRDRAVLSMQASLENGVMFHSPGALEAMLAMFGQPPEEADTTANPDANSDHVEVQTGAASTPKELFAGQIFDRTQNPNLQKKINAAYRFNVSGRNGGIWIVDFRKNSAGVQQADEKGQCEIKISDDDFVAILEKRLNPQSAFDSGRLKVVGNMLLAIKFADVVGV